MGGALAVTLPSFWLILKRPKPLFAETFELPLSFGIDRRLLIGASLFGAGWGLSGLCPGPALAGLITLNSDLVLFVMVMLASWWLSDRVLTKR